MPAPPAAAGAPVSPAAADQPLSQLNATFGSTTGFRGLRCTTEAIDIDDAEILTARRTMLEVSQGLGPDMLTTPVRVPQDRVGDHIDENMLYGQPMMGQRRNR